MGKLIQLNVRCIVSNVIKFFLYSYQYHQRNYWRLPTGSIWIHLSSWIRAGNRTHSTRVTYCNSPAIYNMPATCNTIIFGPFFFFSFSNTNNLNFAELIKTLGMFCLHFTLVKKTYPGGWVCIFLSSQTVLPWFCFSRISYAFEILVFDLC